MTIHWIVTGVSLLVALLAWGRARRTSRRLEQLSDMYWELKFQHGELRVQLERMNGTLPAAPSAPPRGAPNEVFVPLSSLKR